jgi:hypothetical protein
MILRGRLPSRDRHAKIIALRQASRYRAPSRKARDGPALGSTGEPADPTTVELGIPASGPSENAWQAT